MILVYYPVMVRASAGFSEDSKIAIAATGQTVEASVSDMAARSPYYLVFNKAGRLTEIIDNPYKEATRGAGASVANFLAQKNIAIVVAGSFGLKMMNTLKNRGIGYLEFNGRVSDVVKRALEIT
jgi:predicted Fe-Mo cluster-binding NifX family protein